MHHVLLLLFISAEVTAIQPRLQPQLQPQVSVRSVTRDVRDMPANHFYLMENASRLDAIDREDYFWRLDVYFDDALSCDNRNRLGWLLELSARIYRHDAIREHIQPRVEDFIVREPRCFLEAVAALDFTITPAEALDRLVINSPNLAALQKSLEPLLLEPELDSEARLYDQRMAALKERMRKAEEQRQRKLAYERSQRRKPLLDPGVLANDPQAYWSLWQEMSAEARACEDRDAVADLLRAAMLHSRNGLRAKSAEFVERLVLDQPGCVLNSVAESWHTVEIGKYVQEPLIVSSTELLAALANAETETEKAEKLKGSLGRQLDNLLLAKFHRSEHRFLRNVIVSHSDEEGRVLIEPPSKQPAEAVEAQLESLWQQAEPAAPIGEWKRERRKLPLEAIESITGGDYPYYQLLLIDENGVAKTTARPVQAWIVEWYCEGRLLLLELAPSSDVKWSTGRWPPSLVLAFNDETPLPDVSEHRFDSKNLFNYGKLVWPSEGRAFSYSYTDSYTEPVFRLEDEQTGLTHYADDVGPMCH